MVARVNLSFDQQQSLENLQRINRQISRSTERLVTQRRVNSPIDGVTEFFLAEQLSSTVDVLERRRLDVEQGVISLQVSLEGLGGKQDGSSAGSLRAFLSSALDTVLASKRETSKAEQVILTNSFREIFVQFSLLLEDVEYRGTNLLTSEVSRLRVRFSDERDNYIEIGGRDLTGGYDVNRVNGIFSVGGASFIDLSADRDAAGRVDLEQLARAAAGGEVFTSFSALADENDLVRAELTDNLEEAIQGAISTLSVHEFRLARNLAILQNRSAFATSFTDALTIARDGLVSADVAEESANLSALFTRNQLAISSLGILNGIQEQLLRLLQ